MEKTFENLVAKFKNIKEMGFVKSVNDNYNGVGLTLENLLGKKQDDFAYPDYEGIEIKTHRKFSKYPITLFGAALWGKSFPENDRIRSTYGYYQTDAPDDRKIVTEFYGNKNVLVCNR